MSDQKWRDFESFVASKMNEHHIAGVAVAISKEGRTVYQKGFGYRNIENKEPVTPDTIFGVASVSKSVAALAIMKLEEEGLLSVDDPVVQYLPEFKLSNVERMEDIKIHHLLSHSTGLAPIARKEEINRLDKHIAYLSNNEHKLLGNPGEYFSYCNDTFLLAGAIVERITGKLYRRYVTEQFLNPLQMYRSTFSIEELEKYDNVMTPYIYHADIKEFVEQPWFKLGNYEVGGGLRSTAIDLLNYGQIFLSLNPDSKQILKRSSLKKMWTNLIKVKENSFYGYALQVTPNYSDVTLVEHGGSQPGVSSHFGFIPEKDVVVAVLCNVSKVPVKDIWLRAINTILHLPLEQKRYIVNSYEGTPSELESLIGSYSSAEGQHVKIYISEGQPLAEADGEILAVTAVDKESLLINKTGETIQFYFNSDEARPWAILFGMRMLTRI